MDHSDMYKECRLCPHRCGVDRTSKERGVCNQGDTMNIAWIGLHKGEEPPLSGECGSGTIFFTGCPLQCPSCQNIQISTRDTPFVHPVTVDELAHYMIELQQMGAASINLVTATHFIPSIIDSIVIAKEMGLTLPVVYNSSGFEDVGAIELIDPYIDLYLLDIKTLDEKVASRFCACMKYPEVILSLLGFLQQRYEKTFIDDKGYLHGLLIRHLVFPGSLESSYEVLDYFASHLKERAYLSLMVQYIDLEKKDNIDYISSQQYEKLLQLLDFYGIENGFVQELEDNLEWIPDFTRRNPFPSSFATPLKSFIRS
ncbi:MAG: radical SAM protein [Sphaerochaetaceae bacterium]